MRGPRTLLPLRYKNMALFDTLGITLLGIFVLQAIVFFRFYSRDGANAVYCAPFAWCIDLCAIASGSFLMGLALYIHSHRELFNFDVPLIFIIALFVLGSWQMLIHAVKWYLRVVHKKC